MINIRHTGIVVKDMEKSINFYVNNFGFEVKKDQVEQGKYIDVFLGIDNLKVRTVKMSLNNNHMIELLKFHSHPSEGNASFITDIGCSHFAMTVRDADSLYEKLKKQNIDIINKPRLSPDGLVKVFFCKDHDGTWLELVEEL
tara:strand:+ start:81 stop:506 length:426 start_codon:yes stop_codon:yes gene_type:complete